MRILIVVLGKISTTPLRKLASRPLFWGGRWILVTDVGKLRPLEWADIPSWDWVADEKLLSGTEAPQYTIVYNDKSQSTMKQSVGYVATVSWLRSLTVYDRISLVLAEESSKERITDGLNSINYHDALRVSFDSIRHAIDCPDATVKIVANSKGDLPDDIGFPHPCMGAGSKAIVVFKQAAGKPFETANEALSTNKGFVVDALQIGRSPITGMYTFLVKSDGNEDDPPVVVEQPYHPMFLSLKDNTFGGRIKNSWLLKSDLLPSNFSGSGLWRKSGSLLGIHDGSNGYMDIGYMGKSKKECRGYTVYM